MPPAAPMTDNPERRFGPRNTGRLLGGVAFLMLPVALFAPKGLAPLFIIAAVLVIAMNFDAGRLRSVLGRPVALPLAGFLLFAAASAVWSIEPAATLRATLILALTFFGGLYLVEVIDRLEKRQLDVFRMGIIAGGVLGFALIVFERSTGALLSRAILAAKGDVIIPLTNYMPQLNAGMSVFALLVWPWALAVRSRLGVGAMVLGLLAGLAVIFLSSADTPILALLTGLAAAAVSLLSRRMVLAFLTALTILGVAAAPLIPGALPNPETEARAYAMLSHSAVHRLAIWRTAAKHIAQSPVAGIGLNGTRFLYSSSDKVQRWYATDDPKLKWGNFAEPIPLHAHNGVLQIWLELGGVGAALFAGALLLLLRRIGRGCCDGIATAARLGMLVSGLVIFSSSFGPWQNWWQAAIWLSIAAMTAAQPERIKA